MKFQRSIAVLTAVLCCFFAFQFIFGFANAASDPVRISSGEELQKLKEMDLSGKTILLTKNINLNSSYTSFDISNAVIDGGGYTIYGATKPIFGTMKNSSVKNLGVSGASTSTGMLANSIENTNINSCYFDGRVSGGNSGFIAATNSGGKVTNVAASGSINASSTAIFFGSNSGTVSNSWFAGTIKGQIGSLRGYSNCYYDKEAAALEIALSDLKNASLGGAWTGGNYPTLKSVKASKYAIPFFRGDDGVHRGLAITARTADGKVVKSGQQASGPITLTAQGVGKITYSINGGSSREYVGPVTLRGKDKIVFTAGGYSSGFTANSIQGAGTGGNVGTSTGGTVSGNSGKGNAGGDNVGDGTVNSDNPAYQAGKALSVQMTAPLVQDMEEPKASKEENFEVRDPMNGSVIEAGSEPEKKSESKGHAKGFGGEAALLVVVGGILAKRWFIR